MTRYAMLVAALGVGLFARDDLPALPDDLARVPATAQAVVTVRVAALWDGGLGRDIRKVFGKDLAKAMTDVKDTVGISPESVERVTFCAFDLTGSEEGVVLVRHATKLDPKKVPSRLFEGGTEQKIAGQTVLVRGGAAGFLSDDGRTLGIGSLSAVRSLLEAKPARPPAGLAAMLDKATKHHVAAFVDPAPFAKRADQLPAALGAVKPLLAAKGGVAWLDVGPDTRLGARLTFADEKAAARAGKAVDVARKVASLTLSGAAERIAGGSKEVAALLAKAEAALDDAAVVSKGSAVEAALGLTIDRETTAGLIQGVVLQAREMATRAQAANNLKQIGIAMHNYHNTNGTFPPPAVYDADGKALLSWRVLILPYVEQDALYREFRLDEPWDSPHNRKLVAKVPPPYVSPQGKPSAVGGTFYQGIHGNGAFFDGKRGLRLIEITDGSSNTLMVVEASADVPWTKPGDLPFGADGKLPKVGGLFDGGFNALFCDGSVRFLKAAIKPDRLKLMILRSDGMPIPADD
ncbi:MAG: DUF1559 domain-containing protein [Gemmataceae bacterium]